MFFFNVNYSNMKRVRLITICFTEHSDCLKIEIRYILRLITRQPILIYYTVMTFYDSIMTEMMFAVATLAYEYLGVIL